MKHFLLVIVVITMSGLYSACQEGANTVSSLNQDTHENLAENPLAKVNRTMVWADCNLYASVVTPATFKATSGSFDQLYAGGSFKDGIGLISESKPGDHDYNGGRWRLNLLKPDVPADKYASACSAEDLDLNDFEAQDVYFECPLLPRKN